jgi:hypothetical protein
VRGTHSNWGTNGLTPGLTNFRWVLTEVACARGTHSNRDTNWRRLTPTGANELRCVGTNGGSVRGTHSNWGTNGLTPGLTNFRWVLTEVACAGLTLTGALTGYTVANKVGY